MRIVVDTALNAGAAEFQNMGDVSMLQVAVDRLKQLWPDARIDVLTESPENLAHFCPGATPLSRIGRNRWIGESFLLGRFHEWLPETVSSRLRRLTDSLEAHSPTVLRHLAGTRLRLKDDEGLRADLLAFLDAIGKANLFMVCGAGGFTQSTRAWDLPVLKTLELANRRRIPTAMFGQQMGPLNDPEVRSMAERVLPSIGLITLRGTRGGEDLLESLGVKTSSVLTTGDEAIELAYRARPREPGRALGINIRVAPYAQVDSSQAERIGRLLQEFARRRGVPLFPLPIASHRWADDCAAIRLMLRGFDDQSDGGATLDTPIKVIQRTGQCRAVVTGAYHAAVFALAQGIPVVGLANGPDYMSKFLGLSDQFGLGCAIVRMSDPDMPDRLTEAIDRAWDTADVVRAPLQQSALRQVEASWNAYRRVKDMIERGDIGDSPTGLH